jgi:hypothetical protein
MKRHRSPVWSSRRLCLGSIDQRSKRRASGRAGRKPWTVDAVERARSTALPDEVGDAHRHDLVAHVRGHLRVDREADHRPIGLGSDDGHGDRWEVERDYREAARDRDLHRLVEPDVHRVLPGRLPSHEPRRGPVFDAEAVGGVEGVCPADRRGDDAHDDQSLAGEERGRVEHDAEGVRRLDNAGVGAVEARLKLGCAATDEGQRPVDPHPRRRAVDPIGPRVHQLERHARVDGHSKLVWARVTVDQDGAVEGGDRRDGVDVERGQLEGRHGSDLLEGEADGDVPHARELGDVRGEVGEHPLSPWRAGGQSQRAAVDADRHDPAPPGRRALRDAEAELGPHEVGVC